MVVSAVTITDWISAIATCVAAGAAIWPLAISPHIKKILFIPSGRGVILNGCFLSG
jgi:hypothetical protein